MSAAVDVGRMSIEVTGRAGCNAMGMQLWWKMKLKSICEKVWNKLEELIWLPKNLYNPT